MHRSMILFYILHIHILLHIYMYGRCVPVCQGRTSQPYLKLAMPKKNINQDCIFQIHSSRKSRTVRNGNIYIIKSETRHTMVQKVQFVARWYVFSRLINCPASSEKKKVTTVVSDGHRQDFWQHGNCIWRWGPCHRYCQIWPGILSERIIHHFSEFDNLQNSWITRVCPHTHNPFWCVFC